MILHLLFDDIFGEYAVKQFSGEEMCSEFVTVVHSSSPVYSHKVEGVRVVAEDKEEFQILLQSLDGYKAIVFHGLFFPWQERVLQSVPDQVKVAWVFWGGDIYGRRELAPAYLSSSSRLLIRLHKWSRVLSNKKIKPSYEIPFSLLQRIDYCLTDVHEDFVFVKQYLNSEIREIWYNYYSVEETLGELADATITGKNVLVGNSSSIECNHLHGFSLLRRLHLGDSKIVAPLGYGEIWLKNKLLAVGRFLFGHHFWPIIDFIPRKEYNQIIQSCSTIVMPHYRQQAFGNILTALWLGSRVFLSERNCLFAYFKRIGAVVFSVEHDLNKSNPLVLSPLSENEIEQNRKVIKNIYGREVMHRRNLEIVRVLNQ